MDNKEYLPPGINEDEFVEIVKQAGNNPAYKFQFGYHDVVDMLQQSMMIAIRLMGYKLLIINNSMPESGEHLVVICNNNNKLHIKLFDKDGKIVFDEIEDNIKNKLIINKLKEYISQSDINWYNRKQILDNIYIITKHKPVTCKFKPRGEKPMRQQLANFLRVWLYNRLSNFRRDNCCKYPNNGGSNQIKFNLQYALPIGAMGLTNSEIFAVESELPDRSSYKEVLERLHKSLKTHNKRLYNRYISGEELNEIEFSRLERAVRKILTGVAEDYIG